MKSVQGRWYIRRKTAKGRFRRALKAVAEWCRSHRHRPMREQHQALSWKLKGHYGYYGITGNADALQRFRYRVLVIWHQWLRPMEISRQWQPLPFRNDVRRAGAFVAKGSHVRRVIGSLAVVGKDSAIRAFTGGELRLADGFRFV